MKTKKCTVFTEQPLIVYNLSPKSFGPSRATIKEPQNYKHKFVKIQYYIVGRVAQSE